jgi:hypothetical protein
MNMHDNHAIDPADINLPQDAGMSAADLDHSLKVDGKALEIARRVVAASRTPRTAAWRSSMATSSTARTRRRWNAIAATTTKSRG